MTPEKWDQYLTYLDILERNSKKVLRELDDVLWRQYPNTSLQDFREEIDAKIKREMIYKALLTLSERERTVIIHRFGLFDNRRLSLDECGQIFNVQRERIRQIEHRALMKLRHPKRKKLLLDLDEWKESERKRIELQFIEEQKEKSRKKIENEDYQKWWEETGKAESEEREKLDRIALWLKLEKQRVEQENLEKEIIEKAKEVGKRFGDFRSLFIAEDQERKRIALQKEIEEQEQIHEAKFIKNVAFELINKVREEQKNLAELTIARNYKEDNESRPYIWDAIKKKKRYQKKDGKYE